MSSIAPSRRELCSDPVVGSPAPREERFRVFFAQELDPLTRYAFRLTGNASASQDLAQEALVRTWGRWTHVADPHAYAYLVATNLVRKQWRQDAQLPLVELPAELAGAVTAGGAAVAVDLRDLVQRLPRKLRATVLLHYFADLPVEQVAALTGQPTGSVRRQLHEARTQLRTAWSQS